MSPQPVEPRGVDQHLFGKVIGLVVEEEEEEEARSRWWVSMAESDYFGSVSVVTKTLWGKWNYRTSEREPQ